MVDDSIYFNEIQMQTVAPVKIIDIVIGAPEVLTVAKERPLRDGALYVRRTRGTRSIGITFTLLEQNPAQRRQYIHALTEWAQSQTPQKLRLCTEPLGYLNAVCTSYPTQSSNEYWEPLKMTFTAFDPYFHGPEIVQAVNMPVLVKSSDAPSIKIVQQINSPLTNPAWTMNAESLTLVGTVGVGELIIDFDKQTITLNGASLMSQLTIGSVFFDLQQGSNVISTSNGAGGVLTIQERWV